MSRHHNDRVRRRNLMAVDPHCFWCGREVHEYPDGITPQPDDMATVDHLISKNMMKPRPVPGVTVLSCVVCNQERQRQEVLALRAHGVTMLPRQGGWKWPDDVPYPWPILAS